MININKLDKNQHYLLACSFGVDSMCLADLLIKNGYKFSIAFVNYHLRKESDIEEKNIKMYAKKNNLDLYIYDNKEKIERNVEATCRNIRYNFFLSLCNQFHFSALLVAHQLDDHIETYYLQKNRKSLLFYYGLKEESFYHSMKVIRPLLNVTKEEIINYNNENNVPYSIDATNLIPLYERNKIRIERINKMSKEEKITEKENIDNENAKISKIINDLNFNNLHKIPYLLSLDKISFIYALNILIKRLDSSFFISKSFALEIKKIISSLKSNIKCNIKNNVYLEKSYDELHFYLDKDISYSYVIYDFHLLDNQYFYFNVKENNHRNIKKKDFPLTIRNAKKDDEYKIKNYKVKLNKLFKDYKMPLRIRKVWPVIENVNKEIIYVPRYKKGYEIKQNEDFYVKVDL
ncbi:MAG: tRNA lysidine(34) synthetase TilS [Bacilli bacterium]